MSTKTDLENALKEAMRSSDDLRKRTIRMALAAIRMVEVERGKPLDEAGMLAVLQKEVKSRQEAIADAQRAHRPDLEAASQAEIGVLEGFLPQPLSPEAIDDLARQAVAEVGATSPREMGQVMKVLIPRLQGRATGDQASQAVRKLLG
ncbi:MAG TPA: GatB/YqeY domain-containing protein [Anaerolineales bacterium]